VRVLRGGCVPLGGEGVPFAPVIKALRGLAGELDPAEREEPNVTPGYHRRPDLTAAAFDEVGFYRSGDAVRRGRVIPAGRDVIAH
jgi:acyl-CoA synthetase (AMP-forming)/AMP-acid ligase II